MKYFSKVVFLLLLFAFCSALTLAQNTGGVKGKVRTTKGEGIAAATITAKQKDEDVKSTTSDAKGNFVLENLKDGTYNLVFTKNGFSSGVMYNVEVKKKKISDLGERLVLTIDQGTQVIIKGSVFAADGRSVGGAEIKVERISSDGSIKKLGSSLSSYSGEFTFKFPQGAAKYRVTASAKGASASKELEVDSAAIYRLAITLDSTK
ncbi:MAG: carboxypeptidase-like regulatory domain-containing protein [Acidobacteriota bacterium]|nr:carboxypeptidase-like regulatory domain-containing protein [Acidobacteriota bacterium]